MEQAANTKQANFSMSARERAVHKTTVKEYAYNISAAVANAILVTLGMGLLMQTIAGFVHFQPLYMAGTLAQDLLAPALGIAVAVELRTTTLVMFSSMIAATVGSNAVHFVTATKGVAAVTATGQTAVQAAGTGVFSTGQPVSAVCAALIAALLGKYLSGKTPLDMVLVPFAATMVGTRWSGPGCGCNASFDCRQWIYCQVDGSQPSAWFGLHLGSLGLVLNDAGFFSGIGGSTDAGSGLFSSGCYWNDGSIRWLYGNVLEAEHGWCQYCSICSYA